MNTTPDQTSRYSKDYVTVWAEDEKSIGKALELVVDRGQRFITDSARLVRFDLEQVFRAKARGWTALVIGIITLGLSWLALMVSAGMWLARFYALELIIAAMAGLHVVAGAILVWRGVTLAQSAPPVSIPGPEPEPEARDEPE